MQGTGPTPGGQYATQMARNATVDPEAVKDAFEWTERSCMPKSMNMFKRLLEWFRPIVCIHPYYERKLHEAETFLSGYALAKYRTELDRLAESEGQMSLNVLGFSKLPLTRGQLHWNEPTLGLKVFSGLSAVVKAKPDAFSDATALVSDLEKICLALREAEREEVRFTLVHRFGTHTNALVWEQGGGSI